MPNYDPSLDNSPITRVVSTNADGSPNYSGGTTVDGEYLATPPTLSDTQTSPLMLDSSGNLKEYQATKNDPTNDAISSYSKGYTPINLTASGQILAAPGSIKGYTVNSYTATATVRIADNTAAGSGYLGAALTIAAVGYQEYPANVATGGYITISGTADITFFVRSGSQA